MQLKVQHSNTRSRKSAIIHEYNVYANYRPSDYRNPLNPRFQIITTSKMLQSRTTLE